MCDSRTNSRIRQLSVIAFPLSTSVCLSSLLVVGVQNPYSCGVTIAELSATSANELWQQAFLKFDEPVIRKVFESCHSRSVQVNLPLPPPLSFIYLCIYLSVSPSVNLTFCLSVCLFDCPSVLFVHVTFSPSLPLCLLTHSFSLSLSWSVCALASLTSSHFLFIRAVERSKGIECVSQLGEVG